MRKKSISEYDGKSLKTFILYATVVLLFILISLSIKFFFIVKASKFDGKHQLVLSVAEAGKVREVIAFKPAIQSLSVLKIKDSKIEQSKLGKTLGILPDATLQISGDTPFDEDVAKLLSEKFFHYQSIKTDMTLFDIARLIFLEKNIQANNRVVKEIKLPQDNSSVDKIIGSFFVDEILSTENITVQIVNATEVPGIGSRLERILSNIGANVVDVSTSAGREQKSQIKYFGKETYTVQKLQKALGFPLVKIDKEQIANIVVVIGEDSVRDSKF
jgi:hypothetical protein